MQKVTEVDYLILNGLYEIGLCWVARNEHYNVFASEGRPKKIIEDDKEYWAPNGNFELCGSLLDRAVELSGFPEKIIDFLEYYEKKNPNMQHYIGTVRSDVIFLAIKRGSENG